MKNFAVNLDVSLLPAPEPMQRIIRMLSLLPKGYYLSVFHRKKPKPLFAILEQQNYDFHHESNGEEQHFIFIWPSLDTQAKSHFLAEHQSL
ncbi:DUF2249 domain-containing protein [Thalassotalea atypica]|uniref:DUF2249 domain-containing protein n=1 Tax=Thalassotalea atypica TaxID=2054316 RepID=UPI002572A5F8|nr:DUF2249 domain-containing protein [Thalassotalea atypica]